MTLKQICEYLRLSEKEVLKKIHSEGLPAFKIGGVWRFRKIEVDDWLQKSMRELSPERLKELENGVSSPGTDNTIPIVSPLIKTEAISTNLKARSSHSVIRELCDIAVSTGLVYDPDGLFKALLEREKLCSTSMEGGAAIPHPRKRQEWMLAESFIVVGIHTRGIPFGAPDGSLTDIGIMPLCITDREHLKVLARVCRMLQDSNFLNNLRNAEDAHEVKKIIKEKEDILIKSWKG